MSRKLVRVTKFLLAVMTVFCVSWIVSVNEWHSRVHWRGRRVVPENPSTLRTIVAYSEEKQAELDRPSLINCNRLPAFPKVPYINYTWSRGINNATWQRVRATSVSLYSAFYDERTPQRYVRILAIFHGRKISLTEEQLYCQTRPINPNENSIEVVAAKPLEIWWQEWDKNSLNVEIPVLLSCPLTGPLNGPSVVSVVTQPCDDPSNGFYLKKANVNKNYDRIFTICVKNLQFEKDITTNLIEWIETNKLLGANMIDIYIDSLSKESEDILLHYRSQGHVRLFQVPIISSKNERKLWQKRRDHMITYNDCLYRNIGESKYIVPLDIDEILVPKLSYTWPQLLKRLTRQGWNSEQYSAILIRNVFFFEFMQGIGIHKYKYKNHTRKSKAYIKRDDVRIKNNEQNILKRIELTNGNNNFKNNLKEENDDDDDDDDDEVQYYKSECGERQPLPKLASHIISSAIISPVGQYSKSFMLTKRVLTAFNHYPLASLGTAGISGWSAPFSEVQVNHYKETCNSTVMDDCEVYSRRARIDRSALRLKRPLKQAMAIALCLKLNKK